MVGKVRMYLEESIGFKHYFFSLSKSVPDVFSNDEFTSTPLDV